MTTPRKPTAREIWEAMDKTFFRAEVDRINGLSDQELEVELLKKGFRPEDFAEHEKEQSETAKPENAGPQEAKGTALTDQQLARGWRYAMKLLDEEADRIAHMSDEEFERFAAENIPEPTHIPTVEELFERAAQRAVRRR
ncbi:MAG: hypothetical protein M3O46_15970 [Myxococcota bacterium]|nr:hypothetical protein [Myxococcota bacterium]